MTGLKFLFSVTFLLAISSILSRLLGVYRNHALASLFGATGISDAYFAAFQIPDTVYRLLVFGAISASFVPLFLTLNRRDDEGSWQFVSTILNSFLIVILLISLAIFFLADAFVGILYPDFSPELQLETVRLLKVMLLSPIFFTFSSVFSGIQNAFRTFWGFAMAPIVYNAGIILGILVLSPTYGIMGVAYGVVLGSLFHAGVQLVPAIRLGLVWKPVMVWSRAFKTLLMTAIPRILSMAGFQLNFFIEGVIATSLLAGNLTILRYAQDIQSFPIGVIGVSVAISSFSVISHFVIDDDQVGLAAYLRDRLDHVFMLMIPASVGLYVLRYPLITLILKGGVFDQAAVESTAVTLSYLCIGLLAAAVVPLVTRVFFAYHDTLKPFVVTVITVILNTALAIWLARRMGVAGIGLASSLSMTANVILLMIILRITHLKAEGFFPWVKTAVFSLGAGVMGLILVKMMESMTIPESTITLLVMIVGLAALGVAMYFAICFLCLRNELVRLIRTIGH